MTSHLLDIIRPIDRPLARSILFSRPKQSSKDKQRETTAKLRREVTERLLVEAVAKAVGR